MGSLEMANGPGSRLPYPLQNRTRVPGLVIAGAGTDMGNFEMDESPGTSQLYSFEGDMILPCVSILISIGSDTPTLVPGICCPRLCQYILTRTKALIAGFRNSPLQNLTGEGDWGAWNELKFFKMEEDLKTERVISFVSFNIVLLIYDYYTMIMIARNSVPRIINSACKSFLAMSNIAAFNKAFHREQGLARPVALREPVDNAMDSDENRAVHQPDGSCDLRRPRNSSMMNSCC